MDNLKYFKVELKLEEATYIRVVPLADDSSRYNSSHFDFREEEIENLPEIKHLCEQHSNGRIFNIKARILPKLKAISSYVERQNLDLAEAENPRRCNIGVSRQEREFLKELNMPFSFRERGNRIPLSIYIFPVEIT